MKITVLGGTGKMACISVRDLARDESVGRVVIAEINLEQAKENAAYINSPKITIQ